MFPFSLLATKWKKLVDRNHTVEDKASCIVIDSGGVENMFLNPWQTEWAHFPHFTVPNAPSDHHFSDWVEKAKSQILGRKRPWRSEAVFGKWWPPVSRQSFLNKDLLLVLICSEPELSSRTKVKPSKLHTALAQSSSGCKSNTVSGIFFISTFIPPQSPNN